jgi:hypothetical protein
MQYFSIVARKNDSHPRTCAMIQDATLQGAATKARTIIESRHLPHIDRNSHFSIRKSSRRETSLLQSFLATKTGDNISTYLPEDFDSLMSRRKTMLLSFFMALYIDPDSLKKRFSPQNAGRASNPNPSGSGGTTMDASEASIAVDEASTTNEADESSSGSQIEDQSVETGDASSEAVEVVGDDNQLDALADIVNGGGSSDVGDDEIDLF